MKLFLLFTSIFITTSCSWFVQEKSKPILRVMTYSSFAGVFGPGEWIQKEFETICNCKIKWIKVSDSTLFVQRLSLKKDGFKTDVVMGLDQISLLNAKKLKWRKVKNINPKNFISPVRDFVSDQFVPYNWSPMTFLARKKTAPMNIQDLLNLKYKNNISLPSPKFSTAGLQFYYWIWTSFEMGKNDSFSSLLSTKPTKIEFQTYYQMFRKEKNIIIQFMDFLNSFKEQLYGLPPSWSTSYALFQRGHVHLSFSYLSSLLYHQQQNQTDFYAISFKDRHPFQVEFSAVSDFCTQCDLANQFVQFLQKPKIQKIFFEKNYMFPVNETLLTKDTYNLLSSYNWKFISYGDELETFLKNKELWLKLWDSFIKK